MCFVFISEQTASCATYNINGLVFITEIKSVYSAVRTGSLNRAVCVSSLKINFYMFYMFKNTTAAIYCSVCSSLLNCIILIASSNIPV
jgi:hypothetical protein